MNENKKENFNKENENSRITYSSSNSNDKSNLSLLSSQNIFFLIITSMITLSTIFVIFFAPGIAGTIISIAVGLLISSWFIAIICLGYKSGKLRSKEEISFSNRKLEIFFYTAPYLSVEWENIKKVIIIKECFLTSYSGELEEAHNLEFYFSNNDLQYRLWKDFFELTKQERIIKILIEFLKKKDIVYEFKIKEEPIDYLSYKSLKEQHYSTKQRYQMKNDQSIDNSTYSQNKVLMRYPKIKEEPLQINIEQPIKKDTEEIRFSSYNSKKDKKGFILVILVFQLIIIPFSIGFALISYLNLITGSILFYFIILGVFMAMCGIPSLISKREAEDLILSNNKFEILFYKIPYFSIEWERIQKVEIIEESFKRYGRHGIRTIDISHNIKFYCNKSTFEYRLWWYIFNDLSERQEFIKILIDFLKKKNIIYEFKVKKEIEDLFSEGVSLWKQHKERKKKFKQELKQQLQYSPYASN